MSTTTTAVRAGSSSIRRFYERIRSTRQYTVAYDALLTDVRQGFGREDRKQAGNRVALAALGELGTRLVRTHIGRLPAPRAEPAARWGRLRVGQLTTQHDTSARAFELGIGARRRRQQGLGVRVRGRGEQLVRRRRLHDAPEMH